MVANSQAGSPAAMHEAKSWQQNAAAFLERLEASFPMYRDLVLPIKQAVLEVHHGLSVLSHHAAPKLSGYHEVLAKFAAFPQKGANTSSAAAIIALQRSSSIIR